jgi:hypothetical protein
MTSESRRAVAFALAEATRRTGLAEQRRTSRPARRCPGRPRASPGSALRRSTAARRRGRRGGRAARAGDLGQQRVAWTQRSTGPGRRRPSDARPAPGGTVRALAVAPQHGLPVAQVAQRPNRQLPPFQGSSRLTNSRSAVRRPSGRTRSAPRPWRCSPSKQQNPVDDRCAGRPMPGQPPLLPRQPRLCGGDLTSHQVTISGSQMSTTHWPT